MTALASRSPYPAPTLSGNMYRQPVPTNVMNGHNVFTSPTESEFSESYKDGRESVVDWDEVRVAEWLKSINCSQYVEIFRKNNITGENLMDIDQATLKEMGVKKIGDRVRIGTQAKVFRSSVYKRTSKRVINRVGRPCMHISGVEANCGCSTRLPLWTATLSLGLHRSLLRPQAHRDHSIRLDQGRRRAPTNEYPGS